MFFRPAAGRLSVSKDKTRRGLSVSETVKEAKEEEEEEEEWSEAVPQTAFAVAAQTPVRGSKHRSHNSSNSLSNNNVSRSNSHGSHGSSMSESAHTVRRNKREGDL